MLNTSDLFGNFMQSYVEQQNKDLMGRVSKTLTQGISNHPKSPLGKSTDNLSFLQGLQSKTNNALGKVGQEAKWFGQDLASNIGGAAKAGGIGVGGMVDMGAGLVDSTLGSFGLKGAEVSTGLDNALDTVSSLPLELIPGFGTIAKGGLKALSLINKYGGKKSKQQGTDYGLATLGYDKEFNPLADKKYGLFSRKSRRKTNALTAAQDTSNLKKSVPGYMETQNMYASQNAASAIEERNFQNLHGDTNLGLLTARLGTKIPPVNFRNIADRAVQNVKKKKSSEVGEEKKLVKPDRTEKIKKAYEDAKHGKYKEGGLLTKEDKEEVIEEVVEEKMNVIPEGAFHSRLNKINEDIAEHVTRKGIPVITKDGDKIIQHAEVERNEIIFHKEATDTIETLLKKYEEAETDKLKDEIAIECGKYIAEQILVNTDDRTGIIETIEYA